VGRFALIGLFLLGASPKDGSTVQGHVLLHGKPVAGAEVLLETGGKGGPHRKPQSHEIHQKGRAFHPDALVIHAGDSVVFINDDTVLHNVFSHSEARDFDLGKPPVGSSRTVTFDKPGQVDLFCDIHASMKGMLVVVPDGLSTTTDEAGAFTLRAVPAGKHRLDAWQGASLATADVPVGASDAAPVELTLNEQAPKLGSHFNKYGAPYADGGY
jgi:plastocyanin